MSLDHILLGVLEEPQSGYDLKRWFDEVFSFFWNADQSQIYRTMNRLAEDGLVRSHTEPSAVGPARHVYRTTAAGRAALRRWLKEGPVSPAQRSALYAQLIFLARLPDRDAAAFIAAMQAQADELVAALETISANEADEPAPKSEAERREAFFNRASLALGLARARATQVVAAELAAAHRAAFPTPKGAEHGSPV